MKTLHIVGNAANMVQLAIKLGNHNFDSFDNNWNIRNTFLRAVDNTRCLNNRYNGYSVFDPITKQIIYKSNSPIKIVDKQMIIAGRLWRKYYSRDMR